MAGPHADDGRSSRARAAVVLAALGVVFGDIGTSPLYAVRQVFDAGHGIPLTVGAVMGGVSAIFWTLVVIVSVKYVLLIMRADNKGEGGIMALLALASSAVKSNPRLSAALLFAGVYGAALFYGDGVITPAISVLSAVEGLEVGMPALKPYIVPTTLAVLIALFAIQKRGTSSVGALFGPVMVLWFVALACAGLAHIARTPAILGALDPVHAFMFITRHGYASFLALGAVFLAVTGAEALYADMGHFGKAAVRRAWFMLVFPALALNYFGQGALLIAEPRAVVNPFYLMFPSWAVLPMVVLATAATVIASQAVISGTYSMTRQAIQLGFLPRMNIVHTSEKEAGQIYVPTMNWTLLAAVIVAVIGFGSSTALGSAYGLAVSGTMLITTVLTFFVLRYRWQYSLPVALLATSVFLVVDLAFFSANLLKFLDGGWFPLAMGSFIFSLMITWRRGRRVLFDNLRTAGIRLEPFLKSLFENPPLRVPGTAVFLVGDASAVPHAMLHNLSHNKVLHERIVILTVVIADVPWVSAAERVNVEDLGNVCYRVRLNFGFKDNPDVPQTLATFELDHVPFNLMETSFFISREKLVAATAHDHLSWWEKLFALMSRNAGSIVDYFNIPPNRVIELGTQVEI